MIEPVESQYFVVSFLSAAMVILCGALYALLVAWSRLRQNPRLMHLAYLAYFFLFVSVMALASVTHLYGFWQILVMAMLLGYLLAPHGIWYLCQGIHMDSHKAKDITTSHKKTIPQRNSKRRQ